MAFDIFLKLETAKVGWIEGDSTRKGHEKWIDVLGYHHEVFSPTDAASGLPTGKRQHKPFQIFKELDKSSPLIMGALVMNENVTKATVELTTVDSKTGATVIAHRYTLDNGRVIRSVDDRPAGSTGTPSDSIELTYQRITWEYVPAGISAQDDWESPVV